MRLTHVSRSFKAVVVSSALVWIAAGSAVPALTISSPTEGRIVRDKVPIVIARSQVPTSGSSFLVVKIDGRFLAAVSISQQRRSSDPVYVWDAKSPIDDPLLPEDQRRFRDGQHEITVELHEGSSKESVAETAKVNVVLKNEVPRTFPAPPLKLRYRYPPGQQSKFRVSLTADLLDLTGYGLTGSLPPFQGGFKVVQAVEDASKDGSALLRYMVDKDSAYTQILGQPTLLGQSGMVFHSVYKLLDSAGRTLENNVLSSGANTTVTDCLVALPGRPLQVGESWPTTYKLKLEGMTDLMTFSGTSTLSGLEWEGGYKCAKITTNLNGSPTFAFLPQGTRGPATVTSTAFFAYEAGKLIKNTVVIEFNTTMDTAVLESLQQYIPQSTSMAGLTSGAVISPSGTPYSPRIPGMAPGMPGVPPGMSPGTSPGLSPPGSRGGPTIAPPTGRTGARIPSYTPPGSSTPGSGTSGSQPTTTNRAVKVKLVITTQLVGR